MPIKIRLYLFRYVRMLPFSILRLNIVPSHLMLLSVLTLTILGLVSVILSEALSVVVHEGQSMTPYWLQTGAIAFYLAILVILYIKDGINS